MGNLAGLAEEDAVEKVLGPGYMGKNSTAQGRRGKDGCGCSSLDFLTSKWRGNKLKKERIPSH